jgi:hypothetical protein
MEVFKMARSTIFTPFAQKYLLRERWLHDKTDGALRLLIDSGLGWHWGIRDDKLFSQINRDFEKLAESDFELYSAQSDCMLANQSTWNMEKCMDDPQSDREKQTVQIDKSETRTTEGNANSSCGSWRMEHLAYYSPAHTTGAALYGIHLSKRGLAKVAQQVHGLCPDEPLEIVQMASVYKLFAHEMCHAWIEDICCMFDFSNGESAPADERIYAQTQRRWNGYILMEEAICNTAAYGWLRHFLFEVNPKEKQSMPAFDAETILRAFEKWMRSQPAGYRDFVAIEEAPPISALFIQNICRLLMEVYKPGSHHRGWDGNLSRPWHEFHSKGLHDVVGEYFGAHLQRDLKHISFRKLNRWDQLWIGNQPLHVEY